MIEFRVLGPAELRGPQGTEPGAVLARPKLLGLLTVLAADAPPGFHRRDALIGLFWSELDQDRARSAVRQSLYRLRQYLGERVIVTRGDDEVTVAPEMVWCDVAEYEAAVGGNDLEAALALYRGDLLDGFYVPDAPGFERWLDQRRQQLREHASQVAWRLADREAALRHTAAAGQWSRRARNLAPLDERLLRRVIKLLDDLGDRAGAVREYEQFARRLANELELEPAPETRALIEGVRARGVAGAVSAPDAEAPTPEPEVATGRGLDEQLRDRYAIERQLGVGGMATVYLARDLRHDRMVAVKVMHPELAATIGKERFLREIRIAARLAHPHIVPLYDSGAAGRFLFYVMPYVEGESLRDRLQREGPLPIEEALGLAREMADALAHAHTHDVVHRDIKPENILLSGGHAVVADFGIARAVTVAGGNQLTRSGATLGTPPYMSPEQGAGASEVDGRSDVYSLGCVLFEMLAGQPPFTGPTAESVNRQHLLTPPQPITDLRPTVPDTVAAVVARALAKTPADRFATARQFAEALSATSVKEIAGAGSRRWLALLVGVPAVLLVAAIALVLSHDEAALDPRRVVVLPFENRTGDTMLTVLGQMGADWVARGLQEIDVIDVVPTATGVEPGPDVAAVESVSGPTGARRVGRAANAGTVVAGAYYRRGDSLEFQVQIIDAGASRLVRAVSPVTGSAGVTAPVLDTLRRRVVASVASALDYRLLPSSAASPPPSLDAYRVYLEGHRTFYGDRPRMQDVLRLMYRAVELDTGFTDPRFFLVMAHANLGEYRLADSNAQLLVPYRSRFSTAQRALHDWLLARLRGDRAGALRAARARRGLDVAAEALLSNRPHETIAVLSGVGDLADFYYRWEELIDAYHMIGDYQRELAEARRARAVYPDRMRMLEHEIRALAALGRLEEVDQRLEESLLLPPEDGMHPVTVMGRIAAELHVHGHRRAALRAAERGVAWLESRPASERGTPQYRRGMAMTLYTAERWEAARPLFEALAAEAPRDVNLLGYLGVLAARLGEPERARELSDRLAGTADPYDFGRDVYWQACIAAQLGARERAMVLLREAYARGRAFSVRLHADMDLLPLHSYPPFQEFIAPKD